MTTENKIKCVLMDFEINKITLQEATKQVLDLFDVSGSCEWCGTAKKNPNGLCKECGRFPSPSNYR